MKQKMYLLNVLLALSLSVLPLAYSSANNDSIINNCLIEWKNKISGNSEGTLEYSFLVEQVAVITSKMDYIALNESFTKRIYPLAKSAIKDLYLYYDLQSLHSLDIHGLASHIYDLMFLFKKHMSDEEILDYFCESVKCIITNGTDWSYMHIYIEPMNNESLHTIVDLLADYFTSNQQFVGIEPLISFFLHYSDLAMKRNLSSKIISSGQAINSLLFINQHKSFLAADFMDWLKLFFECIDKVFENHFPKLKILLDLSKDINEEADIDWIIGIFSENNISSYIYEQPAFLASILDTLLRFHETFPNRFLSCVLDLGKDKYERLGVELEKRYLKKEQISLIVKIRKSISNLVLTPENSFKKSIQDSKSALNDISSTKLEILSDSDKETIGSALTTKFFNIYELFNEKSTESEESEDYVSILLLLNDFIPLLTKLGAIYFEVHEVAKKVTCKLAEYYERLFLVRKQEIGLNEIAHHFALFHGEVLTFQERVPQLSKFIKNWKLNLIGMQILIELFEKIDWYHEQIFILNVQQRIIRYLKSSDKIEVEFEDIIEIFHFYSKTLGIISKSELILFQKFIDAHK